MDPALPSVGPGRAWLRRAGLLASLTLLGAAVILVLRQREALTAALTALRHPAATDVLLLVGSVVANLVLSGLFLRLLILRYGRVGVLEMQAVVAAATLANFLPLRPGLFGRLAYHRTVNGIPLSDGARTVVQAALISGAIAVYLAGAALLSRGAAANLWTLILLPPPILLVLAAVPGLRPWAPAVLLRYAEVLLWAVRYGAAFRLIGSPIDATAALALACASVIATMVPFFSNGLGLREWAIGLLAPILTGYRLELGVTAELVNRAAEIAIVVAAGLAGAGWLMKRRGSRRAAATSSPDDATI